MDDYDHGYIDGKDLYIDKVNRLEAENEKLKADLQYSEMDLRNQVSENVQLKRENEQLRETVTNQEIVIRCHQEASQSLDIGMGD